MIQVETTSKVVDQIVPVFVDWTEWLGADTLASSPTVTVDGTCTTTGLATADGVTSFLLGGGTAGARSLVTVTATAVGGKREVFFLRVEVLEDPS